MSNPVIQFEKGLLFLAMQNYDVLASVSWRDVIKYLRWALNIEKYDAFRWIGKVQEDIDHLYPDRLEAHLSYALFCCERVFQTVHLLRKPPCLLYWQCPASRHRGERGSSDRLAKECVAGRAPIGSVRPMRSP